MTISRHFVKCLTNLFFVPFLDVDECIVGSHMCDHVCHNTAGSFRCSCQSGYRLMADLTTCIGERTGVFSHQFIILFAYYFCLCEGDDEEGEG